MQKNILLVSIIASFLYVLPVGAEVDSEVGSATADQSQQASDLLLAKKRQSRKNAIQSIYLVHGVSGKTKAVKLLNRAIDAWADDPTPELNQVCRMLFSYTFDTKKYDKQKDALGLCPDEL